MPSRLRLRDDERVSDMHAAIDIGTNSVHLVVARATPGGGFDIVTTEKEMVRLGSGGGDMKRLAPDAVERAMAALTRMVGIAASFGADVTAVATSAVREAENRHELVDRAEQELGLPIEVISGLEEARLIFRGVIHGVPAVGRRMLVVDIGGGSTELIIGERGQLVEARSLRLGAIRLTGRYFDGPAECRHHLEEVLSGVSRELGGHRPELAVGSSGTAMAVASMVAAARGVEVRQWNGFELRAEELDRVVDDVLARSAVERRRLRGLDERRADIIVGGVLLLQAILATFGLDRMAVSDLALREGVLYDRFPAGPGTYDDLRRANVLGLARQLDPDVAHAETCARLAVQLFDRTADIHGLGADSRELLDLAALVHNVGLFISHSGHHKHSWYIIRNSERLTGFTEHEIELIALVARYHRKSFPHDKHPELAAVPPDDRRRVAVLAGLLRVAIGLDRRHLGHVGSLTARLEPGDKRGRRSGTGRLVIEPVLTSGAEADLEVFSANERAGLLAQALGLEVVVAERQPAGEVA